MRQFGLLRFEFRLLPLFQLGFLQFVRLEGEVFPVAVVRFGLLSQSVQLAFGLLQRSERLPVTRQQAVVRSDAVHDTGLETVVREQ